MNRLEQANAVVTLAGAIPTFVAYIQAKYFFHFRQRSPGQVLAVFLAVIAVLGTIFLQSAILEAWGLPGHNEYLRKLTAVQYTVAAIVFFWRLNVSTRSLAPSASESEDGGGT